MSSPHRRSATGASTVSSAAPTPSSSTAHLRSLLPNEAGSSSGDRRHNGRANERTPLLPESSAASTNTDVPGSAGSGLTWRAFDRDGASDDGETRTEDLRITRLGDGDGASEGDHEGGGRKGPDGTDQEGGQGKERGPKRKRTSEYARVLRRRSRYYIPVTEWLPRYNLTLLTGDMVAGISVACLLIPQAMSYANGLAKLNPVAGLWSAAIPALVYGILGTCRQLSLGPEAALSLLIGQMIQEEIIHAHHPPKHIDLESAALALVTTFQVGIITSCLGLLRLGFLDVILSRALLRGFLTAVGVIMFIEQLVPMLGLADIFNHPEAKEQPPTEPFSKLVFILKHSGHTNRATAILGFSCLAVLIFLRMGKQALVNRKSFRWLRFVPEIFLIVVGATILTGWQRWDRLGVDVIGQVSGSGHQPFGAPLNARQMNYFSYTFPTAFVSAIIGVVDSVVAARENGAKYGYAVSANRDLVALGASNLVSGFLANTGGVPVFGSITRSRLNGQTGGRTQMSGIITAVIIVLAIYFLLPLLEYLPKAVLGAIVTLLAYTLVIEAPHDIHFFWRTRAWVDLVQMLGTFILTLAFSIETGLVASVIFSLILVVQKSTQTRIKIIGRVRGTDEWVPVDEDPDAQEEIPGVLVVRIRESLSFANTGQLKERLRRLELYGAQKSHPSDEPRRQSAKTVILHMGDVDEIDASALQILYELTQAYTERGVGVHYAHLKPAQMRMFALAGITDVIPETHFHRDLREAMREVESLGYGTSTTSQFA